MRSFCNYGVGLILLFGVSGYAINLDFQVDYSALTMSKSVKVEGEDELYSCTSRLNHLKSSRQWPQADYEMAYSALYMGKGVAGVSKERWEKQLKESKQQLEAIDKEIAELEKKIAELTPLVRQRKRQQTLDGKKLDFVDEDTANTFADMLSEDKLHEYVELEPTPEEKLVVDALTDATAATELPGTVAAEPLSDYLEQIYLEQASEKEAKPKTDSKPEQVPDVDPKEELRQIRQEIKEILNASESDNAAGEENLEQVCDAIQQDLADAEWAGKKVIKLADSSGKISGTIDAIDQARQIQAALESAKKLNETAGEHAATSYLCAKVAQIVTGIVGGMFNAASTYLEVGAKTLEVGTNVVMDAKLGQNKEVPAITDEATLFDSPPNKMLAQYGQKVGDSKVLNVSVQDSVSQVNVYTWKQVYIGDKEAWVPYDENANALPYVMVVKSRPRLGLFGKLDMDVYKANTRELDKNGKVELLEKGTFKG